MLPPMTTTAIFRLPTSKFGTVAALLDQYKDEWTGCRSGEPAAVVQVDDCGPGLRAALVDLGASEVRLADLGLILGRRLCEQYAEGFAAAPQSHENYVAWLAAAWVSGFEAGALGLTLDQGADLHEVVLQVLADHVGTSAS